MQCVCFVSNAQQGKWHHPVEWHTILGPHMCSLLVKQTVSGLFSSETHKLKQSLCAAILNIIQLLLLISNYQMPLARNNVNVVCGDAESGCLFYFLKKIIRCLQLNCCFSLSVFTLILFIFAAWMKRHIHIADEFTRCFGNQPHDFHLVGATMNIKLLNNEGGSSPPCHYKKCPGL